VREEKDTGRLTDLTKAKYDSKKLDAEHVYSYNLSMAKSALEQGLDNEVAEHQMEAIHLHSISRGLPP